VAITVAIALGAWLTPGGPETARAVDPPTVTSVTPATGPVGGGTLVTLTGANFGDATAVTFGGTAGTGIAVNPAGTLITVTSPAHAAGTVDVRVITPAGTSPVSPTAKFEYGPLPAIFSMSPTSGSTAGGTLVTLTGVNFTGATEVTFGSVPGTGLTVLNSGTQITITSPARTAGTVSVRVTTGAGTSADTAADNFTFGGVPTVSSLSPTSGPTAGGTVVTVTGTGFLGALSATFGGAPGTSLTINSATQLTVTTPAHLAGAVDVVVNTAGGSSNPIGTANDFTFTDTGGGLPVVTAISPHTGPTTGGTLVTITGSGFTGLPTVRFGGVLGTGVAVNATDTQITVTSPAHAAGTVDVIVTTSAGPSANTAADNFTYGTAPAIFSISPTSGPPGGGTAVTITGVNFTGATSVKFGTTTAVFAIASDTQINATSPVHAAGTVDVSVATPLGTSANTAADNFTFTGGPVVTAVTPAVGSTAGGTLVTVTGSGFTGTTSVTFGGVAGTSVSVLSATSLTVVSPAHAAGTVDVIVTTAAGSSANSAADNFTYTGAPTVTAVSPTTGPAAGGTTVTVTGTGLTGATAVTFGGTAGTSITVLSATSLTVVSPAHAAGTVDIRVTTPAGTSANTAADNFTYTDTIAHRTFRLSFRWTLVTWLGKNNIAVMDALRGVETPADAETNDVSSVVTAVAHWDAASQTWDLFFPTGVGTPGANDFTTLVRLEPYFIAVSSAVDWTIQEVP
jgi:hypothetical protein